MRYLRERLQQYGVTTLSSPELLALVLCTSAGDHRTHERLHALFTEHGGLQELLKADFGELSRALGNAKAVQLQATLELARRLTIPQAEGRYRITTPQDAAHLVMPEMMYLDHEEFRVLVLDTKNQVVANLLLYQGTVDSAVLRIAEIFRPAIARKCSHIIVCHNHPSGQVDASPEDIAFTQQCLEAGKLLDIDLVDHLIIGHHRFLSLKEYLRW
jgi:DNA repair protein RadC